MTRLCSKTFYGSLLPRKHSPDFIDWYGMSFTTCLKPTFLATFYQNPPCMAFFPFPFPYILSQPCTHLHYEAPFLPLPPTPVLACYLKLWDIFQEVPLLQSLPQTQNHSYHVWFFLILGGEMTFLGSWQLPLEFSSTPIIWKRKCSPSSMPVVYISPSGVSTDTVTSHFYWAAHNVIDDIWGLIF